MIFSKDGTTKATGSIVDIIADYIHITRALSERYGVNLMTAVFTLGTVDADTAHKAIESGMFGEIISDLGEDE